ncbi:hypothetical protein ACWD4F_04000 [Streptomyces aureus]|uniref:hypothetical protein n=1 Tax=Streptomyces aureus TaxID=193461 RepID=UPI00068E0C14|nr:hypothetical protein [Streptomyces aureus]
MSRDDAAALRDTELEKDRARYGLIAVVMSNVAIAGVAVFGVWRLDGDKAVIVGVLTAAFTAVSSMTTAYLGIKAVSNTARSIALGSAPRREPARPAAKDPAPEAGSGSTAPAAEAPAPPAQRAP